MTSLFTSAYLVALLKGLATSAGLIVAIGAQNAFVLAQGLKREHHWPVAWLCFLFDAVLITAGTVGVGALVSQSDFLMTSFRWLGACFLFAFGLRSFYASYSPKRIEESEDRTLSLKAALVTTAVVTLFNPHAYLDTLVLIGSIGGQYAEIERYWFTGGAISFSFIWFFGIAYGARYLRPVFQSRNAWRILDLMIGVVMWAIAVSLLWPRF